MNIRQKIWSIPIVTILVFTIGMAVAYHFSSNTYELLQRTGNIHYPYLYNIQALAASLKGIQENFQNAVVINDKNSISRAQLKALEFRKITAEIARLEGKKAISEIMLTNFEGYFASAEHAVTIMLDNKKGDVTPDLEKMIAALHRLEDTLKQENIAASVSFLNGLENSKTNVQEMLWINLANIVLVAIVLVYISYRLITSIMRNLGYLQTWAQRIAHGDYGASIPEMGKDELTQVINSFNSMGINLQIAYEKQNQYERELITLNLELEDRITARTAELGVALEEANKSNVAVAYLAEHDALTGLLNRRRFQEEFDRWGKHAVRYERAGALMFIDLDKFKDINDGYGHQAGDEYLVAVSGLLKNTLRSTDFLGRWGGDEFIALVQEVDSGAALATANKLIKSFRETLFSISGNSMHASVSIGIAVMPDHTKDIVELMNFADAAMYKAKEAGRGCCRLYSASEQDSQRVNEHARWAGRIRRAMEVDQFVLFYQPLLDLKSGGTSEYEALLRMEDTEGHFVSPSLFLGPAEQFGLSVAIDRMVIRKAIYKLSTLKDQKIPLKLSLNLSHKTLDDAGMVEYIDTNIKEFGIDPKNLAFEIAEATMLQNMVRVQKLCVEISKLGCSLILDDIGLGFSSVNYLLDFSISEIKIKGDLIRNLHHEQNHDYVVALCKLCHEYNIKVVAKFVEDASMLSVLHHIGIDYAQGFAVGNPLESLGGFGMTA
jgi:diguanylate cyclase (GGDEF)-like protein